MNGSHGEHKRQIIEHLLAGRRLHKQGAYAEAEVHLRQAIVCYARLPQRNVGMVYSKLSQVISEAGRKEEATEVLMELYHRTRSVRALVRALYICGEVHRYHRIGSYLTVINNLLAQATLKPNLRVKLLIILAKYDFRVHNSHEGILAMEQYQQQHGGLLRETLSPRRYFQWLFRLQQLLSKVPGADFKRRARYLYEAMTIAEQHKMQSNLSYIYSSLAIDAIPLNLSKAKDYLLKAEELAMEAGNTYALRLHYSNLSHVYRLMGETHLAYSYYEKVEKLGIGDWAELYLNGIDLAFFCEDYEKGNQLIDRVIRAVRKNRDKMIRMNVHLYRFHYYVSRKRIREAERMWPTVERILDLGEFPFMEYLRGKYKLLKGRPNQVIAEFLKRGTEEGGDTEGRIRNRLVLIEAYMQTGKTTEGLQAAQETKELVISTGYLGYIPWVYLYLGRLYQRCGDYAYATLHFKRAKNWFGNYPHRLREIDRLMHQQDNAMLAFAEQTLAQQQQVAGKVVGLWLRGLMLERDLAVDELVEKDILFEAIQRVGASILVRDVCEQLAAVVFDQLSVHQVHFLVQIDRERTRAFHVNDQLQFIEQNEGSINRLMSVVLATGSEMERREAGSYRYAFPILAHDKRAMSVIVLERNGMQGGLTEREKRFLGKLLPLVASNIKNAILYETMVTDHLTGLYARDYFMNRLQEEFVKVSEHGGDLSFAMIDLDDFSKINNTFGHNEGDRVLRQVAQVLKDAVGSRDIVGRFGGEELIVIMPNTSAAAAKATAERILHDLRNMVVAGDRYRITASIGVGSYAEDQPVDMIDLIEKADRAETLAKRFGKDQVLCHWELQGRGDKEAKVLPLEAGAM